MATIGVFCGALVIQPPDVGGGISKKKRRRGQFEDTPEIVRLYAQALREDEDFIAVLQAYLSRKKH